VEKQSCGGTSVKGGILVGLVAGAIGRERWKKRGECELAWEGRGGESFTTLSLFHPSILFLL